MPFMLPWRTARDSPGLKRYASGGGDLVAFGGDLAERAHLVDDPEAAAVGGDGEIVAVDDDVAHGGDGHVVLQAAAIVRRR